MVPTYGCDLWKYVFRTVTTSLLTELREVVTEAIELWEQRIELLGVQVTANPDQAGRVDIDIDYRVRRTNVAGNLVFPFYLANSSRPGAIDMAAPNSSRPLLISRWTSRATPRALSAGYVGVDERSLPRSLPKASISAASFAISTFGTCPTAPGNLCSRRIAALRSLCLRPSTSGDAPKRSRRSPGGCGAKRMSIARKSGFDG